MRIRVGFVMVGVMILLAGAVVAESLNFGSELNIRINVDDGEWFF